MKFISLIKLIVSVTFYIAGAACDTFNINSKSCTPVVPKNISDLTDQINAIDQVLNYCDDVDSLLFANDAMNNLLENSNETKLFEYGQRTKGEETQIDKFFNIFDTALKKADLYENTAKGVSARFLTNFNTVVNYYANSSDVKIDLLEQSDKTHSIQRGNIIVMVIDPYESNVTGFAIHKKKLREPENNFKDFNLRKLFGHETALEIIDRKFEVGVNIPSSVIEQLKSNMSNIRIVFSIFYKDSWFLEDRDENNTQVKVKSKTIGITIPEYPEAELPDGIFTVFKRDKKFRNRFNAVLDGCSNWIIANGSRTGKWDKNFKEYESLDDYENLLTCNVKQATFSGYVQLIGSDKVLLTTCDTQVHEKVANVISILTCSISIVCIVVIFILAWKIETWRLSDTTPLILHLSCANGLQMLFYILIIELKLFDATGAERINYVYCFISGAILHYITLVAFFLSLFSTDHLIRTYIIGTPQTIPLKFETKVLTFGWLMPMLIIGLSISIDAYFDSEIYLPTDILHENSSVCYPAGDFLILSVHLPIVTAIVVQFIIFIWIIVRTNQQQENLITNIKRMNEKCGTYMYAFSILSITWVSAVIVYYTDNCWIRVIFSYLFVTTATSQGLLIFLSCVVFDGKIRRYFKRIYQSYFY